MNYPIIIHRDHGLEWPWPLAYAWSVDRRNRLSIRDEQYALGYSPPNYPMPAKALVVYALESESGIKLTPMQFAARVLLYLDLIT